VHVVGCAWEEQTYHYAGFICDNLEHICDGNVAQTLGYCQRCGSILGQTVAREYNQERVQITEESAPWYADADQVHLCALRTT
jgi:hypothetical protein